MEAGGEAFLAARRGARLRRDGLSDWIGALAGPCTTSLVALALGPLGLMVGAARHPAGRHRGNLAPDGRGADAHTSLHQRGGDPPAKRALVGDLARTAAIGLLPHPIRIPSGG